MKNVTLIEATKGYFLTIVDSETKVYNTWAVTELEMLTLQKILNDTFPLEGNSDDRSSDKPIKTCNICDAKYKEGYTCPDCHSGGKDRRETT